MLIIPTVEELIIYYYMHICIRLYSSTSVLYAYPRRQLVQNLDLQAFANGKVYLWKRRLFELAAGDAPLADFGPDAIKAKLLRERLSFRFKPQWLLPQWLLAPNLRRG